MMMKGTIDRFEGAYAVIETEDRTTVSIEKKWLGGAKEGDIITFTQENGTVTVIPDPEATKAQEEKIQKLMDKLFRK